MTDTPTLEGLVAPKRISRREVMKGFLAAGAAGAAAAMGYGSGNDSAEFQTNVQGLTSRLMETARDSSVEYGRIFADYSRIINDSRSLAQKTTTEPEKLVYSSIEAAALMHQADLLNNKAGNNLVKGEEIRLAGIPVLRASSKATDSFYNKLKAMDNYEEVMQIHEDMERSGHKLPDNIGYGMGNYGKVTSRDLVNQRMFETVNKLIDPLTTPNLPRQYEELLRKRGYELSQPANQAKLQ